MTDAALARIALTADQVAATVSEYQRSLPADALPERDSAMVLYRNAVGLKKACDTWLGDRRRRAIAG